MENEIAALRARLDALERPLRYQNVKLTLVENSLAVLVAQVAPDLAKRWADELPDGVAPRSADPRDLAASKIFNDVAMRFSRLLRSALEAFGPTGPGG